VNSFYRKKFATFENAEIHYGLTLSDSLAELVIDRRQAKRGKQKPATIPPPLPTPVPTPLPPSTTPPGPSTTPPPSTPSNTQPLLITVENVFNLACLLENADLELLLNKLFMQLAVAHNISSNPANYCSLSIQAMELLKKNNKHNLLYKFALALCKTNQVTDEPVFPMDRMPFGLVEYQIEFFSSTNVRQVCICLQRGCLCR
jgi:hypothetical protein